MVVPPFATFVFEQLPPAPCRVLEVGCGRHGGLVEELVARGYDATGVDPDGPAGDRFVRAEFQTVDGEWDAAIAANVLHHVNPLAASLDHLARLTPLLVVDEFAPNAIGAEAQDWYEGQHRMLRAAGTEPHGPPSIDRWREGHVGLHPDDVLLRELRARWEERAYERVPFFQRWLGGPSSEALEQSLIDAGAFPAIGYRWAGSSTSTTRSSAVAR
jgi:hypothetical protein